MTTPLLMRFVAEARELLQAAASGLLVLERAPGDEATINTVFRSVHTLKGSVGLFDFPAFATLVHAGEDVLSAVRAGHLGLDSEIVDLLLDMLDRVGAWIDDIEGKGALAEGAETLSREMTARLRALLPAVEAAAAGPAAAATARAAAPAALDWAAGLPPAGLEAARAAARAGATVLAVEYQPAEDCFFSGEDPVGLLRGIDPLLALRIDARESWPDDPTQVDPYRCLLRLRLLTSAPAAEVDSLFRYVIEQVRVTPVGANHLDGSAAAPPSIAVAHGPAGGAAARLSPLARDILDAQRSILLLPVESAPLDARLPSVARTVANVLGGTVRQADLDAWTDAVEATQAAGEPGPALAALSRLLDAGPAEAAPRASVDAAAALAGDSRPTANRVLKVDQAKVDSLMNLIGELVVSKNSLPFLARRAETVHGSREMAREIKDLFAVIDRLAQEMQAAIMAVRMLPVAEVLDRFPRLVRDVARKLGKRVELLIEGEDTAADKNIVEVLGDPLLHIIRNALDHGIESPDDRVAAGKPAVATVLIRAFQESDQVVIEVEDDGRGIDPDKIRKAAVAKGLVDAELAERLSEQQAVELVFLPGFSTAARVSDLSGRGVGMDVVVTAVEKSGGSVTIRSEKGRGTTVRLSLPLSMAVTRVMMVEAGGGMLFGILMEHIAETVRIQRDQVRRFKRAEAFVLRDTIVPLLRLDTLLGIEQPPWFGDADQEDSVLVVRVGGAMTGLVVDHFREGMDIILKPFDGVLAGIPGYAGTALLGDGRVLLVLNLKELL